MLFWKNKNRIYKLENLDQLLSSNNLNKSIIEIDNFVSKTCSYGKEIDKLSEPQKQFWYNQNLEREVNNGGFYQYFINSSGNYAHETTLSLKGIGANKTANILQQAINQFPDKQVPKIRDKRIEVIKKIEEKTNKIWEELTREFLKYKDNLNVLNIEFVKSNKDNI